jgi:hypothetical protein
MRRLALAAAVAVLAAPGLAAADGTYFSFGMGPTSIKDELASQTGDDGLRVRLAVGHRLGNLAFEGFLAPEFFDLFTTALATGVDARYILPISSGLQVYVRGSMSRLSTTLGGGDDYASTRYGGCCGDSLGGRDYAGNGLGGGVGVQLRGRVRALGFLYWPLFFIPAGPKVNAALYIDHGYDYYRLQPADSRYSTIDAKVSRLTFGFNVGADF